MRAQGTRRVTDRVHGAGAPRHFKPFAKRLAASALALAFGFAAPLAATPPANAATLGSVDTAFQIDGDMAGPNDWNSPYGPGVTPDGDPTTGLLGRSDLAEGCATGDTDTVDGTASDTSQTIHSDPWVIGSASPNKKSDLCRAGSTYEIVDVDGTLHVILYQYWTRAPKGTGDLSVFFELEGGAAGRTGDYLLEFNIAPNGSTTVVPWSWNGSVWVQGAGLVYEAATGVNPFNTGALADTFGEFAVDLTASGLLPVDECRSFTTGDLITRTGNSLPANSQLEDFLVSGSTGTTVGNCGGISVQKVVQGTAPAGLTFPYVIEQVDDGAVHGSAGAVGPVSDADGSTASISASIAAGSTHTWTNVLASADYQVAELVANLPTGVTGVSVVCTYQDWFESGHPTEIVTVWQNGQYTGSVVPVFPSSIGATAPTCVITNVVTSLTLDKILVNDHGGTALVTDFTLTAAAAAGGAAAIHGTDSNPAAGSALTALVAPGQYILSETNVAGYDASVWICTDGSITDNVVTVAAGASVTCQITNDDRPARLTLAKNVVNDSGGTLDDSAFTLTASGPTPGIAGVEGAGPVTNAPVAAGVYTIGEQPVSGYTMTGVACWTSSSPLTRTPVVVSATNQITLANGGTAYCEITNDDQQGMLTLVKQVDNRDGGTAAPTAWTLSASGPAPSTTVVASGAGGVANVAVDAGSYSLAETAGPAGYSAGTWSCDRGTLTGSTIAVPNGVHVTCTIVNDDVAPLLTLVKQVVNDDGGTAQASAWTLTATGTTAGVSGATGDAAITNRAVVAGTYSLSETGPAGYAASAWDCEGGTQSTPTSIRLAVGESATCTIVNDDRPATLTLRKVVVNDDGGAAQADDWTLTASGPTPGITGSHGDAAITAIEVSAGVYELSESGGPSGYSASTWVCTAGQLQGSTLTLANGVSAVCTITNDDAAPNITLLKTVVNDNGGTQLDTAWTLTAEGPSDAVTGVEGAAAITDRLIEAGSYDLSESGPAGYLAAQWVCVGGDQQGATIDIGPGDDVTCTITNDDIPPTITLVKTVVNDDGGTTLATEWTLSATGPMPAGAAPVTGTSGSADVSARVVHAGMFTLAESDGPDGYSAGDWQCSVGTLVGASLTLVPGQNATCTIENDDQPAELTLIKLVENDSGGTSVDTEWTLTATRDAETSISGVTGNTSITDAAVPAGDYTLTESGPGGYEPSVWVCDGALMTAAGVVTVPNGGDVTCTIINRDIAPTLTLIKQLINDDGGGAEADEWTLRADGPALVSGTTGVTMAVLAGDYQLSESGPAGYSTEGWACEGGELVDDTLTLALDEDVTCTIVNDDVAPMLTLVKQVVNDDGGTALVTDWTLSADGPLPEGADPVVGDSGTAAVTDRVVVAGSFDLAEADGPSGYAAGAWSCMGGSLEGAALALGVGETAVCTIVNDDVAPILTLVKQVVNDDGGTALVTGWTLSADGPLPEGADPVIGDSGTGAVTARAVQAGVFELEETDGPTGYAANGWACTDGALDGSTLTLGVGDAAVCTIVNDDIAPLLTLVKQVVNDDGGEAVATDWTLSAEGPLPDGAGPVSGDSGAPAVTARAVLAGAFELAESGGPAGYTDSAWTCTDGTVDGAGVILEVGDSAICTVVNDDEPVDLALTKDDGGVSTGPGGQFDYTITVTNVGERAVDTDDPVTVVDELPEGFSFVDGPDTCSAVGRTVTCDIDPSELPPGESVVLVLTIGADADALPGNYVNLAFVTTEDDLAPENPTCPSESNNVDCDDTDIELDVGAAAGEVTAVKSAWELVDGVWVASDGWVGFGDAVQYRIALTSQDGPSSGVVLVDQLEHGLSSTGSASCSISCTATYDPATSTHRIELGTMEQDAVATVTIEVTVPPAPAHAAGTTVTETFDNFAAVSSSVQTSTPTNTVTLSASHTLPAKPSLVAAPPPTLPRTGGELPIGIASIAFALMTAGGLMVLRRRDDEALP